MLKKLLKRFQRCKVDFNTEKKKVLEKTAVIRQMAYNAELKSSDLIIKKEVTNRDLVIKP
jgi:hypothetical protein